MALFGVAFVNYYLFSACNLNPSLGHLTQWHEIAESASQCKPKSRFLLTMQTALSSRHACQFWKQSLKNPLIPNNETGGLLKRLISKFALLSRKQFWVDTSILDRIKRTVKVLCINLALQVNSALSVTRIQFFDAFQNLFFSLQSYHGHNREFEAWRYHDLLAFPSATPCRHTLNRKNSPLSKTFKLYREFHISVTHQKYWLSTRNIFIGT